MRHRTAGACETNIVISVMVFIVGFWVYGSSVAAVRQQRASTAAFASRSGIANATNTRTHTHTHRREPPASPESGTPFPPWQRALHRRCTPPPHTTVHVCARTRGIKRVQLPGIYIMMAHHLFTYESISLRCERKCEILCRRPACVCPRVCVR